MSKAEKMNRLRTLAIGEKKGTAIASEKIIKFILVALVVFLVLSLIFGAKLVSLFKLLPTFISESEGPPEWTTSGDRIVGKIDGTKILIMNSFGGKSQLYPTSLVIDGTDIENTNGNKIGEIKENKIEIDTKFLFYFTEESSVLPKGTSAQGVIFENLQMLDGAAVNNIYLIQTKERYQEILDYTNGKIEDMALDRTKWVPMVFYGGIIYDDIVFISWNFARNRAEAVPYTNYEEYPLVTPLNPRLIIDIYIHIYKGEQDVPDDEIAGNMTKEEVDEINLLLDSDTPKHLADNIASVLAKKHASFFDNREYNLDKDSICGILFGVYCFELDAILEY